MSLAAEIDVVLYDTFGNHSGPADDLGAALGIADARLVVLIWDLGRSGVQAALRRGVDGVISRASMAMSSSRLLNGSTESNASCPRAVRGRSRRCCWWGGPAPSTA